MKIKIDDKIEATRSKCTIPQQMFCEEYVRGKPASTAYRDAGYQCKTEKVAYSSASALLRIPKVKAYINALRAQDVESAILSRRERMEGLSRIVRDNSDSAPTVAIRAIAELNRMTDEYRAESINVTADVTLFQAITGKRRK